MSFFRVLLLALLFGSAILPAASAADWMFRPSYYTGAPLSGEGSLYPEPLTRHAYRPAYIGLGPGFAVRGGWRYNTIYLRSGSSTDITVQRENMFEFVP